MFQIDIVIHTYAPSNFSAGVIDFAIAPLKTGQYTFFANVEDMPTDVFVMGVTVICCEWLIEYVISPETY